MAFNQKEAIRTAIQALFDPGQLVELRIMRHRRRNGTAAGWFDDHEALADLIEAESGCSEGIYYTFNEITPALKARGYNRLVPYISGCTSDADIVRRCWLLIDADAQRPKGISATNEEKLAARDLLRQVLSFLKKQGWPEPVAGTSGNGYHALYKVDLPNDRETADLMRNCLTALDQKFGNDQAKIDTKVFNAARITKAYGSIAGKGDNLPERPHRHSNLSQLPERVGLVDVAQIEAVAAMATTSSKSSIALPLLSKKIDAQPTRSTSSFDSKISPAKIEEFLEHYRVEHAAAEPYQNGSKWRLNECLFNPEHAAGDAAVFLFPDGPRYSCFHDSCAGFHWTQFRARLEAENDGSKFFLTERRDLDLSVPNADAVDVVVSHSALARLPGNSVAAGLETPHKAISDTPGCEDPIPACDAAPMRFTTMIDEAFVEIRSQLDALRYVGKGSEKLPAYLREERILKLVWNDLTERGTILHDGYTGYLFAQESKTLIAIDSTSDFQNFLTHYGLYPKDRLQSMVISTISGWALAHGRKSTVHRFAFFNEESQTAYLHLGLGKLARITSDKIEEVSNGTDGVLFLNATQQSFDVDFSRLPACEHGLRISDNSLLSKALDGNFDGTAGTLSSSEQHQLYVAKFISLLFPQLFEAKPLTLIRGKHRSGKSTLVNKVGWILDGGKFALTMLASDQKDVEAALTNRFMVGLDNVDDAKNARGMQDLIAVAATGGSVTRRKLFTTNEEVTFPITAHLYITSRVPPFTRPDVVDRLLIFSCAQFDRPGAEEATDECKMKRSVLAQRDAIMGEILVRTQRVIQGLAAEQSNEYHSNFRVKDFSSFCLKLAHHEGWFDEMMAILDHAQDNQSEFSAAGNPFLALFRMYIGMHAAQRTWTATAQELCSDLGQMAKRAHLQFDCHENPAYLSRRLGEYKAQFAEQFGMEVGEDKKYHRMTYSFSPSLEVINDCSSEACSLLHEDQDLCSCGRMS